MEKSLISSLLRVYHSSKQRHVATAGLTQFVDDYNIGQRIGASLAFSMADRESIRKLLLSAEGIDAAMTDARQWDGLSRTASLAHGGNEKMTDAAVRQDRMAIKALPGKSLWLDGQRIALPLGANLDLDWHWRRIANMLAFCWWRTGKRSRRSTRSHLIFPALATIPWWCSGEVRSTGKTT